MYTYIPAPRERPHALPHASDPLDWRGMGQTRLK